MSQAQAEAHVAAQERLQALAVAGAQSAWDRLPNYDEESVAPFLALVVPLLLAVQRRAVAVTNAFLAAATSRPPLRLDAEQLVGAAIRNGTAPEVVYRRPFVQVWTALGERTPWETAVAGGRERVGASAAMDVQNSMRHTLRAVGEADDLILGYRRVVDSDPCPFCLLIAGRRYLTSELQPVHPRCACSVDVITEANRGDFTGKRENDLRASKDGVTAAVVEHGELGPLLVNGDDHFTTLAELAA